jgi:hypothetical protein
MPLETYLRARRSAPLHVQVDVTEVPRELPALGVVRISARIARIFRGRHLLRLGDDVSFEISVCERMTDIPTGGTWWIQADALARAQFMEVFLDGTPPGCQVALWQSTIIDAPSARPRMGLWSHEPGWRDWLVFLKRRFADA